ncbi:hypothetical protein MRB53_007570 [Persea americana]|uniref:Uncharacterized protein n=1 Tax=Persea americana TaxID=3435 RepID=A0ACC2MJA6_PERAE|nr:hypothetical protein MRB53_007570 [Persea americana]
MKLLYASSEVLGLDIVLNKSGAFALHLSRFIVLLSDYRYILAMSSKQKLIFGYGTVSMIGGKTYLSHSRHDIAYAAGVLMRI